MTELNAKYLALREKDARLFGDANRTLGDLRGRHVFDKDNLLSAAISYYNFQKGEKEIVRFLSLDIVNLIDIAVKNYGRGSAGRGRRTKGQTPHEREPA